MVTTLPPVAAAFFGDFLALAAAGFFALAADAFFAGDALAFLPAADERVVLLAMVTLTSVFVSCESPLLRVESSVVSMLKASKRQRLMSAWKMTGYVAGEQTEILI